MNVMNVFKVAEHSFRPLSGFKSKRTCARLWDKQNLNAVHVQLIKKLWSRVLLSFQKGMISNEPVIRIFWTFARLYFRKQENCL